MFTNLGTLTHLGNDAISKIIHFKEKKNTKYPLRKKKINTRKQKS